MAQPEVTVEQGRLRGSVAKDIRGNNFFKFQGIPYAKPPLGELRFKSPQPPEKWSGTLDATKEGDPCYSDDPFKKTIVGSENCLFLNVYTKRLPNGDDGLSPVLFWIHGGGFIWGSSSEELYGPDFLVTEDVVLVTINYRLGLLGFLSLEDPSLEVPGNAGFKDQVMALKWVQSNISKFGGDPNNVTIFGESAGAVSAHLLMLSPMTKGLFHKVIAQSGCAYTEVVRGSQNSKLLAQYLNLEGEDEKTILEALVQKPVEELLKIREKIDIFSPSLRRFVGFVVEKNSKDPFLNDEPANIILSGRFNHVPFMTGFTSSEGIIFDVLRMPNPNDVIDFENYVPWFFGYKSGSPELKAVANKIEKFYFGDKGYTKDAASKKFDMLSDCIILYGLYVAVENQYPVSKAPTYLYRMSIDTELNYFKRLIKLDFPGVSHLDDIGYLFKNDSTPEIKPGSIEDVSMSRFVRLWTNFAKFGNPTPDGDDPLLKVTWKPVTGPNLEFLDIGEELTVLSNPETKRINFWKKLWTESPAGQKRTNLE